MENVKAHVVRSFIRLVLEAERDAKELEKLNAGALKKQGFKGTHQELQAASKEGPLFSLRTLNSIETLGDGKFPRDDRKRYTKWLATQIQGAKTQEERFAINSGLSFVKDWVNGTGTDAYLNMSFANAFNAADEWHMLAFNKNADDELEIHDENRYTVYSWKDDWTIVEVPAGSCSAEGKAMGHCVGGYARDVEKGDVAIFSLRDPRGRPHATIETEGNQEHSPRKGQRARVIQIKGKGNEVPKPEYAARIKEWLTITNDFDYHTCTDYFMMLPKAEQRKELMFGFREKVLGLSWTDDDDALQMIKDRVADETLSIDDCIKMLGQIRVGVGEETAGGPGIIAYEMLIGADIAGANVRSLSTWLEVNANATNSFSTAVSDFENRRRY